MTELELKRLLEQTSKALDDYRKGDIKKGWFEDDIKKLSPEIIKKAHVLFTAGNPCPTCGGSGKV